MFEYEQDIDYISVGDDFNFEIDPNESFQELEESLRSLIEETDCNENKLQTEYYGSSEIRPQSENKVYSNMNVPSKSLKRCKLPFRPSDKHSFVPDLNLQAKRLCLKNHCDSLSLKCNNENVVADTNTLKKTFKGNKNTPPLVNIANLCHTNGENRASNVKQLVGNNLNINNGTVQNVPSSPSSDFVIVDSHHCDETIEFPCEYDKLLKLDNTCKRTSENVISIEVKSVTENFPSGKENLDENNVEVENQCCETLEIDSGLFDGIIQDQHSVILLDKYINDSPVCNGNVQTCIEGNAFGDDPKVPQNLNVSQIPLPLCKTDAPKSSKSSENQESNEDNSYVIVDEDKAPQNFNLSQIPLPLCKTDAPENSKSPKSLESNEDNSYIIVEKDELILTRSSIKSKGSEILLEEANCDKNGVTSCNLIGDIPDSMCHTPVKSIPVAGTIHTPIVGSFRKDLNFVSSTPVGNRPGKKVFSDNLVPNHSNKNVELEISGIEDDKKDCNYLDLSFDEWLKTTAVNESISLMNSSKMVVVEEIDIKEEDDDIDEELEETLREFSNQILKEVGWHTVDAETTAVHLEETNGKVSEQIHDDDDDDVQIVDICEQLNDKEIHPDSPCLIINVSNTETIDIVHEKDAHSSNQAVISDSVDSCKSVDASYDQIKPGLNQQEYKNAAVSEEKIEEELVNVDIEIKLLTSESIHCKDSAPSVVAPPLPTSFPDEVKDINHPGWDSVKKLSTDEERYRLVRSRWISSFVPDPNEDLTCHSYRERRLLKIQDMGPPSVYCKKRKRSATASLDMNANKRQRTTSVPCTFTIDSKINNVRKEFSDSREIAQTEFRFHFSNLENEGRKLEHWMHTEYQLPQYNFPFYDTYVNAMNSVTYNMMLMQNEAEHNRLRFEHEEQLKEAKRKYDNELNALISAREEIMKFCKFYKGLSGKDNVDPTILTDIHIQDLQQMENVYKQFKHCYRDPNP